MSEISAEKQASLRGCLVSGVENKDAKHGKDNETWSQKCFRAPPQHYNSA